MAGPSIPSVQVPVVATGGLLTREWHSFFLRLRDYTGADATLRELVDRVISRVDELEDGGGTGTAFLAQGLGSVVVNGTPAGGLVQVVLDNDTDAPGTTWYYGTGADGMRGWFAVSDAVTTTTDLTKAADAGTGVATLGLSDLANTGVGAALVKISRDSKGRVVGTSQATTGDLAEGANQYFTNARADARVALQRSVPAKLTSGAASPIPLNANGTIPAKLADGTVSNIPVQA